MSQLSKTLKRFNDGNTILSNRYKQFLVEHGDEPYPEWVVDRIRDLLLTPPRVRSGTFSASSSGRCLRAQELAYVASRPTLDLQFDADVMGLLIDGKWRHLRIQAVQLTARLITRIEVKTDWPNMHSYGTADGYGIVPDDHPTRKWRGKEFGEEIKGVRSFAWVRYERERRLKEAHLRQIHRYFVHTGWELFVVFYENKDNQEVFEMVVEPDPVMMRESEKELRDLNRAIDERRFHDLLPSCKIGKGEEFRDCAFGGQGGTCAKTRSWPK